ncbi:MAG TPA: DUF4058 family protein [Planctomycetota bacterium]|nr:DUF4058 family protein [Planctomycetota bacterium]
MPIHDWSLVDAGIFHDFHIGWIAAIRAELNQGVLPQPYYALAEPVAGSTIPDVLTLQERESDPGVSEAAAGLSRDDAPGGATTLASPAIKAQDLGPVYSQLARRIVIRDTLRQDRVVAVLEIVSQGNKDARLRVEQFLDKTIGFLAAGVHLLVVDVQPPTRFVPHGFHALICEVLGHEALQVAGEKTRQVVSYQILDAGFPRAHMASVHVGEPLPPMPVFLLPHHYVTVALESSYETAYRSLARKFQDMLRG